MQVIDRYDRENSSANNFVKNYYKITEKLELDLVSQVYEDIDMNINIAFPLSFKNNYFMKISRKIRYPYTSRFSEQKKCFSWWSKRWKKASLIRFSENTSS